MQDGIKILSWNLLYRGGATLGQIERVIADEKPDLFLMQEVTRELDRLLSAMGGYYRHQEWPGKNYGMAVWSSWPIEYLDPLHLPHSRLPGSFPKRYAQLINFGGITIANVHLSHGQLLNRRQLSRIAGNTSGDTIIMGDFNLVGPARLPEFDDVGPKLPTHRVRNILPFRLDRCLARGLVGEQAKILHTHDSDHHPILVKLKQPAKEKASVAADID